MLEREMASLEHTPGTLISGLISKGTVWVGGGRLAQEHVENANEKCYDFVMQARVWNSAVLCSLIPLFSCGTVRWVSVVM